MALVARGRNSNKALMAMGGAALANYAGQVAFSPTGRQLVFDGIKWIAQKAWNRKGKKNNKMRDIVGHPGALPGSVAAPIAVSRLIRASKPKFTKSKGAITITHRELIGQFDLSSDLVVNDGVTGNIYKLNPSNAVLFPWLQTLAANFDQYKFDSVRLQYVPLCNTTTNGRVALYFDKDSQDTEPADRVELANMAHLTETSPWAEASLNIPVDGVKRFTDDSNTTDRKLVDLGQVGVATYGGPASGAAGDVFVHYTVTFFEPQPSAGMVGTLTLIGTAVATFGSKFVTVVESATALAISFNGPGTYLVAMTLGATAVSTGPVATTGAVVNSSTSLHTGSLSMHIFNVTVSTIGAGVAFTGTSFSDLNLNVTRARVGNVVLP